MEAGHGGASGRYDALREIAYDDAFLLTQLGVEPAAPPRAPEVKRVRSLRLRGHACRRVDRAVVVVAPMRCTISKKKRSSKLSV